jgi:hypothetical protein
VPRLRIVEAPANHIPAWPMLLTRQQACMFLGGIAEGTFLKVCPVRPVEIGANVVRYRRPDLEAWVDGLEHRLPRGGSSSEVVAPGAAAEPPPVSRPNAAVQRALERAQRGSGGQCRRSATSSG